MTTDLAELDEQIAQAQRDLDAAQNRYRTRPRGGARFGGGAAPMQIDCGARATMLDLGLEVDQAIIRLEELKRQRSETALAQLTDPEQVAAEVAATASARQDLAEAEAVAATARTVWQNARGMQKHRADRIKDYRAEIARAEAAIRSAERLADREQTERSALNVA